jgi:hypothetical protein
MIIHETNGYGQPTAGGWQAEKPVAEIVRDAISQGLAVADAPLVESGAALILTGEVQEYRYRFEEKFWSGDVFPMLTVAFRLRDSTSRETLWKHTVTGSGKYHGSFMPSTEFLFRSALDDLVGLRIYRTRHTRELSVPRASGGRSSCVLATLTGRQDFGCTRTAAANDIPRP